MGMEAFDTFFGQFDMQGIIFVTSFLLTHVSIPFWKILL